MAATIEMLDFNHRLDTIIIDEAHMLGDRQRGAIWLQVLLGSPAAHVIVLGSPESEAVVASLAEYLGEELQVERVERFTPYSIDTKHTPFADIKPATAVIAFSRKDVLAIASELNDMGRTTAVVYGALSPAVRREQARKFRDGEAEILVGSDSLSMGLNLPVAQILFSTMDKYDGQSTKQVEPHLVWQIAGRAGRYGFHEEGRVGAIDAQTLSRLSKAMNARPQAINDVYSYGPTMPIVNTLSSHLDTGKLVPILSFFKNDLKLSDDNRFHPYVDEDQLAIALVLDGHALSLDAKMRVLHAPVPIDHGVVDENYNDFIGHLSGKSRQKKCLIRDYMDMQSKHNCLSLKSAEQAVKILTLYCWMHYRFPETFPELDLALAEMDNLNEAITGMLAKPTSEKTCSSCGRKLPWNHSFGKCSSCFNLLRRQRRDSWEDEYDDY